MQKEVTTRIILESDDIGGLKDFTLAFACSGIPEMKINSNKQTVIINGKEFYYGKEEKPAEESTKRILSTTNSAIVDTSPKAKPFMKVGKNKWYQFQGNEDAIRKCYSDILSLINESKKEKFEASFLEFIITNKIPAGEKQEYSFWELGLYYAKRPGEMRRYFGRGNSVASQKAVEMMDFIYHIILPGLEDRVKLYK